MKLGMPTLIETDNIESCILLCKDLELDFIELNMNLPQYQTDKIDIEKLKSLSKDENIFFTIHLDENINVCDFNREVRNAYIKTVLSTIEIAKQVNAPILNMHIHDAAGKKNHLALNTGEIDINEKLNLAKEHNCACVLETKTIEGLKESVRNLKIYSI